MLILYVKDYCPFSARVVHEGEALGLSFELRNVQDIEHHMELIDRGGKHETPYLVDTETKTEMYDSEAIIAYLQQTYRKNITMYVRVHAAAGAKKEVMKQEGDNVFLIKVKEPAERNCANRRIQELLAIHFHIPTKQVRIVSGHHSPQKIFDVTI